jgi:hypothetical protein
MLPEIIVINLSQISATRIQSYVIDLVQNGTVERESIPWGDR